MSDIKNNSDSWGSLLMDGIMANMVQISGLRIVKSEDRNDEQEHLQEKESQVHQKTVIKKDKKRFAANKAHR